MLWEIDLHPRAGLPDREGQNVAADITALGLGKNVSVAAASGYLVQGAELSRERIERLAAELFADTVSEVATIAQVGDPRLNTPPPSAFRLPPSALIQVLLKPGVMDPVAQSAEAAIRDFGFSADAVRTLRKYWLSGATEAEVRAISQELLANDAIEQVVAGPLPFDRLQAGGEYRFELRTTPIRHLDDAGLMRLSKEGQLYLQPAEMQTIKREF
ncbi:MAG: phosphoribosylformylglycinamidine synthase subunit PurS, partial [Pirellulales bacterium]|nr:phosphoribosylformylglycinamidine synthase subunit PurS [Pirellulales bacterium]